MSLFEIKHKCILVGKTNVGKSTLFNCLSDKKISIAHGTPGATRDCIMRDAQFFGHQITVVDSGGLEHESHVDNPFQSLVSKRVDNFISQQASVILFVVSAKDGITAADMEVASMLRKTGKPVIAVINKVDHKNNLVNALDCLRFGFEQPVFVSAAQKIGLEELKLKVLEKLKLKPRSSSARHLSLVLSEEPEQVKRHFDPSKLSLAVVGRPNGGKSTFVNAILNEDRVMTSEIPGTTVDAIDTYFSYAGKEICLIDTAGIRRQRSIDEEVEKMAVARSLCAVDRSDVAIMMISAKEGVTEQDKKIAGIIFEKKKACILAINKWDEQTSSETSKTKFIEEVKFHLPFFAYVPVVFLSAKYGHHVFDAIDIAFKLAPRFNKRINTSQLNRALERALEAHQPPSVMGRPLKMYFATQIDTAPPTFAISCSKPREVNYSYKRYLTNYFRKNLDLGEIPLRLVFRSKSDANAFKRDAC
ncbi:MAG: ribosome biogenesis GTPase Der [Myxococcales bacterium]|nr:ribosome biogenesis GTPase Der [Myxococcales bacterium]USN50882.1 MAG: ribosome biogenesis GTPase Der [Myxococcales bacterium]